jgi:SAM-dependent methyltransferase
MDEELKRYRRGYEKAAQYYNLFANNEDLPFYLSYANKFGSPILDLAAGTGRISFHLARNGFEVVSLENSSAMLAEFKRLLGLEEQETAERIQVVKGDIRSFDLGRKFPLIVIPTSFGHALTTEDQISLLGCVRKHLHEDGIFVVDLFPAGNQPENASFKEPAVDIGNDRSVSRSGILTSHLMKQILSLELTFTISKTSTGEVLEEIHQESAVALVYNREFELLLRHSRMMIVEEFGDFSKSPYSEASGRRIVVTKME